jgi:protein-L-isoaspartate(D-aspartate) O-methyltransferase
MAYSIEEARNWFAEDLRVASPVVHNLAIIEAFAKIPREKYLGAGPWRIQPRLLDKPTYTSPTAEPHHIYHDVMVSIDHDRDLNNGLPSLWAFFFDRLAISPGETILQVGAGVGYFTAILAELATPDGRVIAYEIDENLAKRTEANLKEYTNVEVIPGDATKAENLQNLDAVVVFAGATHVPEIWLSSLSQSGCIVIPFTADDQWGFMLLLEKRGGSFPVSSLGTCGFYHCGGAQKSNEAAALKNALESTGRYGPTS